jgi:hypothetical protein
MIERGKGLMVGLTATAEHSSPPLTWTATISSDTASIAWGAHERADVTLEGTGALVS